VLVAVLALLALGAALIAGAFAAARASARATRSMRAAIVAQAAAQRALARRMSSWSASDDALTLGAFDERAWRADAAAVLDSADTRTRVQRLTSTLFLVAVEASVPSASAPIARRRVRVLLERPRSADSTVVTPPRPLARWARADVS
jgi:hypothetical protein